MCRATDWPPAAGPPAPASGCWVGAAHPLRSYSASFKLLVLVSHNEVTGVFSIFWSSCKPDSNCHWAEPPYEPGKAAHRQLSWTMPAWPQPSFSHQDSLRLAGIWGKYPWEEELGGGAEASAVYNREEQVWFPITLILYLVALVTSLKCCLWPEIYRKPILKALTFKGINNTFLLTQR